MFIPVYHKYVNILYLNFRIKLKTDWSNRYSGFVYSEKIRGTLGEYCVIFANNSVSIGAHWKSDALVIKSFTKY